ncbi:MAG: NAD kinase [Chromatiales bacterium 21-64-14]|nr:MAG: NAD kinase [Chromatiales bacterium 21-64-14]HQU16166.1 NAD(+) kinase [Gammaproteobacteria bacterium]
MTERFQTIGLIGKQGDPRVVGALQAIRAYLKDQGRTVLLDDGLTELPGPCPHPRVSRAELGQRSDLAIIIGGDGTLLSAARSLADDDVPLLGVNLGHLGFLVDVSPEEMTQRLAEILAGRYREERRFLLRARVLRDGDTVLESDALNDVVLHKGGVARMIEFDTLLNGRYLYTQRSDGLIISTPTGSTAYALSGGGPILHPTLDAMVLVPICPHTLSNRPIVVSADSEVQIVVKHGDDVAPHVSCDGQINTELRCGDQISVRRKERAIRLLHPIDHDYFEILRAKLAWGRTPENR